MDMRVVRPEVGSKGALKKTRSQYLRFGRGVGSADIPEAQSNVK